MHSDNDSVTAVQVRIKGHFKGKATVGPTVKSEQWQLRINGFSELTDCKHAGCWNQLIYWNLCTFVVEGDWCKILKKCVLMYMIS